MLLYNISFTKLLFPDPDTPVMQIKVPKGMLRLRFLRLFSLAPCILICFPIPKRLPLGITIFFFPSKYCPVIDLSVLIISLIFPLAIISPPFAPAPGPNSTI